MDPLKISIDGSDQTRTNSHWLRLHTYMHKYIYLCTHTPVTHIYAHLLECLEISFECLDLSRTHTDWHFVCTHTCGTHLWDPLEISVDHSDLSEIHSHWLPDQLITLFVQTDAHTHTFGNPQKPILLILLHVIVHTSPIIEPSHFPLPSHGAASIVRVLKSSPGTRSYAMSSLGLSVVIYWQR